VVILVVESEIIKNVRERKGVGQLTRLFAFLIAGRAKISSEGWKNGQTIVDALQYEMFTPFIPFSH